MFVWALHYTISPTTDSIKQAIKQAKLLKVSTNIVNVLQFCEYKNERERYCMCYIPFNCGFKCDSVTNIFSSSELMHQLYFPLRLSKITSFHSPALSSPLVIRHTVQIVPFLKGDNIKSVCSCDRVKKRKVINVMSAHCKQCKSAQKQQKLMLMFCKNHWYY